MIGGQASSAHKPITHSKAPKNMDGFFHKPGAKKAAAHTAKPAAIAAPAKAKPAVTRPSAKHGMGRKPQPSKTLVRHAVSKPVFETPESTAEHEIHSRTPENLRLKRAQSVPKSRVISRFGNLSQPDPIPQKVTQLAVKQPPEPEHKKTAHHHTPAHHVPESAAETHFKKALESANAHEKHAVKKPKTRRIAHKLGLGRKGMRVATASLALLLLAGFFAYQNIPNISMQIASSRAGFSAQMPGYTPAGFGVSGPMQYGPGYVAVNFASRSDDQNFKVTQRVSSWNSEALADNFLAKNDKQYQAFEDKGRTIYVYDGGNATWVNGGVWYQIEGNTNLKNDQLVDIASSM